MGVGLHVKDVEIRRKRNELRTHNNRLGFSFTAGVLLFLSFMCFTGMFINSLYCEIQARLLSRKVEKEIKQFNKEVELKEESE